MTEQDWQESTDVFAMMSFLEGRSSSRKLRLFACACCRQVWNLIRDERCRRAVEVAEQFADGQAAKEDLAAAREKATVALAEIGKEEPAIQNAHRAADWAATPSSKIAAWGAAKNTKRSEHPGLFREIMGNPFKSDIDPGAFSPTARMLAGWLYEGQNCAWALSRAIAKSPYAGLAEHFTGADRWHPKGCWLADLILGRE